MLKSRSISRRIIIGVLAAQLLSVLVMIVTCVFYERHVHFRAFDIMLHGRAESILGATGESDDENDNVVLDARSINVPKNDLFEAMDEKGRILGRSDKWPQDLTVEKIIDQSKKGIYRTTLQNNDYRFVAVDAARIIDPDDHNGGIKHHVTVLYGAPTKHVWMEIFEAVRFYAFASLLLLIATAALIAWFLRKALSPLHELTSEAAGISVKKWSFNPPQNARTTKELAPLTNAIEMTLGRLEQSFDQQRRFMSDAAHELKTDVAIIKSSLQLLTMRDRSTEEYRRGLEVSLGDCIRLENTVTEMLTLARADYELGNAKSLPTEVVNMAASVDESVQNFSSLAQLRGISVKFENSRDIPVLLNADDCALIISNLLHNALQHSPRGSTVTITLTMNRGFSTLIIEDQGEGIPEELLPHIFEPFFRADASRDRKSGGTGLGLAICKAICDRAKGSITITSTLGAGTQVTVCLPSSAAID